MDLLLVVYGKLNIETRSIISPSVQLGFLCWQDILEALKGQESIHLEKGKKLILEDLQSLLTKKGFIRFKGFNDTIFHQPIIKGGYIFHSDTILNKENWHWPTQMIKEREYYVFTDS
ncbi:hypothetical protein BKP45_03175 [Anaerobacillus alkalidiazotrophicus]|uniref:Uncharacterized protein n=1 Tax=Anaerobacillus alkalidiazotrophicus TaxID=472963 RepID=A0A1S2MDG2_9BACI|nr:hypothetical protein [Anaerobacillus alkalidiazotrophicus]OIJ21715.1 hypothetical protein BKP45_03175 [Anaerobacillus alkalidiazotrophicus]